jgi:hypothetical protein
VSNAAFVLIAIAVIIVVSVLLWLLNRKPQTFMSSIDDFEREMKALGGEPGRGTGAGRQRRRAISPSARTVVPGSGTGVHPLDESPAGAGIGEPLDGAGDDRSAPDPADANGEPQP